GILEGLGDLIAAHTIGDAAGGRAGREGDGDVGAEENDADDAPGVPTGCQAGGGSDGDQHVAGGGVGHEGGHDGGDDGKDKEDHDAVGVAAQDGQDEVADDRAGAGVAQSVGHDQHAGCHPDGVLGHCADGVLDAHRLGDQQDDDADGGHDVHQVADLGAEEQREHDDDKDDVDDGLVPLGDGGLLFGFTDVAHAVVGLFGHQLVGKDRVDGADEAGDHRHFGVVQELRQLVFVGDDALIQDVVLGKDGGAQADGKHCAPDAEDAQCRDGDGGGGDVAGVAQGGDEHQGDGHHGGGGDEGGQDRQEGEHGGQQQIAALALQDGHLDLDLFQQAGFTEGRAQGEHGRQQNR